MNLVASDESDIARCYLNKFDDPEERRSIWVATRGLLALTPIGDYHAAIPDLSPKFQC